MAFADFYLNRFSNFINIFESSPEADLGMIVVIPCYNEEHTIKALTSLSQCQLSQKKVEVIIIINAPSSASEEIIQRNKKSENEIQQWIRENKSDINFLVTNLLLPNKDAGVGLARKIGMDEAVRRFNQIGNEKGIIIGFDADSECDKNFLIEIENLFTNKPRTNGCSIFYEHPLHGNEFSKEIYHSIILYELYLRYYIEALRYCHYPYAYHTLGSSFAVNVMTYCKQGGMNKRKAGEDFYFLHKIIPLGNYEELNTTSIIPSPRCSDRVPFGTGAAIAKMTENNDKQYFTFHHNSFNDLKQLFAIVPTLFGLSSKEIVDKLCEVSKPLEIFLKQAGIEKAMIDAVNNSSNSNIFVKRFFQWMNGLNVLHYLHFVHNENYFQRIPIAEAAHKMAQLQSITTSVDIQEMLCAYRTFQRRKCWT